MNFNFLFSDIFVSIYIIIIVFFWGYLIRSLWRESEPLISNLEYSTTWIKEIDGEANFANNFDKYSTKMGEHFGTPWNEFVETLVLPSPESNATIRNTQSVSLHLNDASIIFPQLSLDFYRAVPNLLTGAGILGTFLGLAAGVGAAASGLTSGDPQQVIDSLRHLLGGASLAFLTSIAGIACSMTFVIFERDRSRKLHLAVDQWVKSIERCVTRVTVEDVALKQLDQSIRTTKELERFNSDLIFSIEKALEERIAGRLSPQLDRLVEAVQGLRADRSSDAGEMITEVLKQFRDEMQERTGTEFAEMAKVIAHLNRTIKDASDGMAKSQYEIRTVLDMVVSTVKTSMDDGANAMLQTMQQSLSDMNLEIMSASKKMAEQLALSSNSAVTELQETAGVATQEIANAAVDATSRISGSVKGLKDAAESLARSTQQSERLLNHVTSFVNQIDALGETLDATHRRIADVAEPIIRAADEIREASNKTALALTRTSLLVDKIDSVVGALEQHQHEIANTWSRYQERFEGIDESLANVFKEIDEGLARYCEQVKEFAIELDHTNSKAIRDLGGATSELSQSIEDLLENIRR